MMNAEHELPTGKGGKLSNWWKDDENTVYRTLHACVKHFDTAQAYRQLQNIRNLRLYGNLDNGMPGMGMMIFSEMTRPTSPILKQPRLTLNVIKSCIDTLHSKIGKNVIKPTCLTSGGDFKQQQRAKRLDKFLSGCFYEGGAYEHGLLSLKDALINGTGILKVFQDGDNIKYEHIFTDEIFVDELDGYYAKPRCMYQHRFVDRNLLMELYPEKAGQISVAKSCSKGSVNQIADLVLVVEAWHLPSGEGASDGRHVMCVETATLLDEPWERDSFPFAFLRYSMLPVGFWGQGVIDELLSIQIEINRLLAHVQESMRLLSAPKLLVANGSSISSGQYDNTIGGIIKWTGQAPEVIAPQTVNPEVFQHIENLYAKAFQIVGISQLSAQSQKPAGLDSGRALREFSDIETERFVALGKNWERVFTKLAKLTILEAKDIAKRNPNFQVKAHSKEGGVELIKWSEVDMPEDRYVLQVFPTSALPSTPAARMQTVQELLQAQLIPPDQALALLDFPDIEAYRSLQTAPTTLVQKILDKILEDGVYTQPEPAFNLSLCRTYGQLYYVRAVLDGADPHILELLRQFTQEADMLLEQAQAPQVPMPPPGGQGGPGPQGAPPAPMPPPPGPMMAS